MKRVACSLLLLGSAVAFPGPTYALTSTPPLMLTRANPDMDITGEVEVWMEKGQDATIQDASGPQRVYGLHVQGQPYDLSPGNTAWIRLHVLRTRGEKDNWLLSIPVPFLDSASVYQRSASGQWLEQHAGDTLAHKDWSKQGLIPAFTLNFNDWEAQDVYLRVRNYTRADIPLQITTEAVHDQHQSMESMGLGWMLGLLVTFGTLSALRYFQHRYRSDLGAAGYALLVSITVAQVNGVLNATVLQSLPFVGDTLNKVISTIAVGGTLLYMRELYALSTHYHRFDRLLGATGLAAIVFAIAILVLDPSSSNQIEAIIFVVAMAVATAGALLSWQAGSRIWPWLTLAIIPQSVCVLWLAAEDFGLVLPLWEIRYITSFFMALSVPTLAYALSTVTHDRKERVLRARQLDKQDALTGLLTREVFSTQLNDALYRVREQRESVALVVVNLYNYSNIQTKYSISLAEQCELRAVVKLHRVLRDVDPASRIAAGKFALLLEGVKSRDQLTERMVKLIASGLTPQPGLEPPVPLQFHAACVLLQERPLDGATALDALEEILGTMSIGTRRPIRFLDAIDTVPVETSSFSSRSA